MVAEQHITLPQAFIKDAVELSVNMLMLNPPQVMSMPTTYDKDVHEIKTTRDKQVVNMVYFRPILYQGRHGAVVVTGQIGNKHTE